MRDNNPSRGETNMNKTIVATLAGAFSTFMLYQFVVVLLSKGVL